MMNENTEFSIGTLVWAKMKSYPTWPGKIVEPTPDVKRPAIKKPMHFVYFYGSENYAWIADDCIWPYQKYKEENIKKCKTVAFKKAVEALEECLNHPEESEDVQNANDFQQESQGLRDEYEFQESDDVRDEYEFQEPEEMDDADEFLQNSISPSSSEDDLTASFPSSSNKILCGGENCIIEPDTDEPTPKKKRIAVRKLNADYMNPEALQRKIKKLKQSILDESSKIRKVAFETSMLLNPLPKSVTSAGENKVPHHVCPPSKLKFGFLGMGIMGRAIVMSLLKSGHQVTVWNRTASKCDEAINAGASYGKSPGEVVTASDITFCCVSTPTACKEIVFSRNGVLAAICQEKGFVNISTVDPECSHDLGEAITGRGGRFLEAPVSRTSYPIEDGTLIVLGAGDKSLFDDCSTCFSAIGNHAFYLGDIGNGCKMTLSISVLCGTMLAGLAEAMALAHVTDLSKKDMMSILSVGVLNAPLVLEKCKSIIEGTYSTQTPLQHMQKDLQLALAMADQVDQSLPLGAAANEVFKHAKQLSYGEHDASAVYLRARF